MAHECYAKDPLEKSSVYPLSADYDVSYKCFELKKKKQAVPQFSSHFKSN